jgi:hypothetical protein
LEESNQFPESQRVRGERERKREREREMLLKQRKFNSPKSSLPLECPPG